MYGLSRVTGYVALLLTPVALLGATVSRPTHVPLSAVTLGTGVVLAGSVTAVAEGDGAVGRVNGVEVGVEDAVDVLAVVAGAVLTYGLTLAVDVGPVLASAVVGLLVGVVAPRVAVPAYCGSFVGMASPDLFPPSAYVVAGGVAGAVYVAADGSFDGFGGKLGTIAMFGCATTMLLVPGVEYASGTPLPWGEAGVVVPVAILAAVATFVLSVRFGLGAVLGSATVGVAAGVGFPGLFPSLGAPLAAVAFCASFVGMSTTDRFANAIHVAAAGAVCGVAFVAVAPAFAGAGGKLGTTAFLSCVATFGAAESLASRLPA